MKADEKTSQALMDFLKPTALGLVGFMTVGACYLQYLQGGKNDKMVATKGVSATTSIATNAQTSSVAMSRGAFRSSLLW